MSRKARRPKPPPSSERALDAIYAEIPSMKSCSGVCATACGPIVMFEGEWQRVKRSAGRVPRYQPGSLRCPMLSPTGRCMVYSVRPFICRLWGTTETLRCPAGCEPERWLTVEEARDIFRRLMTAAGPGTNGPVGPVSDLWDAFAMEAREERDEVLRRIRQAARKEHEHG